MADVILIGSGGHARVLVEAIGSTREHHIVGAIDLPERVGLDVDGVEVIGTDEDLPALRDRGVTAAVLAIGSVGDSSLRQRFGERLRTLGYALPPVVHLMSHVADNARLGDGAFVAAGAVVGAAATIGEFAIINTGAIVDHECDIGPYVHVAPGCALSGSVRVGAGTHLGTGCSVIHCVNIGHDALVGAGAVVVDDLPDRVVAYGSPCRIVRER